MSYNFATSPFNYPPGSNVPITRVKQNRAPTSGDNKNFIPGDEWLDTTGNDWWKLVKVTQGVALWVKIGNNTGNPETLTGNSGSAVGPDTNANINVVGDGTTINIAGNAGTNTLTANLVAGSTVRTVTGNSGGAVSPNGSSNINTVGSGSITVVGNPGTNTTTTQLTGLTNHAVLVGAGTSTITKVGPGTTNSVLVGSTGADPAFSTTSTSYFNAVSFNAGTYTLKTYEENVVLTPTIFGGTTPGTATYTAQYGVYSRIGNMVFVQINLEWSGHTGTGDMMVAGFPYIFAAAASFYPMATLVQNIALPAGALNVCVDGTNNATTAEISATINAAPLANVQMSAAGSVFFTGMYLTTP